MTMNLPIVCPYGRYSSNYGVHSLYVTVCGLTLYYSYQTIVAYQDSTDGMVVCENVWGTTTGKHLNWLDGGNKKSRLRVQDFMEKLDRVLMRHGLQEEE